MVLGQGVVDLTTVPLSPGQRLQVNAEVLLGVLAVKVPSSARVEVDGHAYLGDITVDRQVTSGPGATASSNPSPRAGRPASRRRSSCTSGARSATWRSRVFRHRFDLSSLVAGSSSSGSRSATWRRVRRRPGAVRLGDAGRLVALGVIPSCG